MLVGVRTETMCGGRLDRSEAIGFGWASQRSPGKGCAMYACVVRVRVCIALTPWVGSGLYRPLDCAHYDAARLQFNHRQGLMAPNHKELQIGCSESCHTQMASNALSR